MKIAILGGGNMGGAIALGAIASGKVRAVDVTVSYPLEYLKEQFVRLGYEQNFTEDNAAAAKGADIIVAAVKPWMMEQVMSDIRPVLTSGQAVVSVVAGVTCAQISEFLGGWQGAIFRLIPNTAIALGQSATFIAAHNAPDELTETLRSIFATMGKTFVVEEDRMMAVTALASCGIAYAFRYMDAAVRGGVEMGLPQEEALEIVLQTVRGALAMLETNGTMPQTEIDKVTTPGGITLKGLEAMERNGFSNAVIEGLKASK